MKRTKKVALVATALAAMALAGASGASATTLEIGGVKQGGEIVITASLEEGTSSITRDTAFFSTNTCTESHLAAHTTKFTNPVTGPIDTLSFTNCDRTVTVHDPGKFEVVWTSNTNGTVYWEEGEVTEGSPFGTLTVTSGPTTHIGTLTGVASGHATLHVNAVLDCGITCRWEATYTVTSPTGLGVVQ